MRITLAQSRKRNGWTPEELAKKSGVSLPTIYRLLAGTTPSYDTARKLETALVLKPGTLVFGQEAIAS